MNSRTLATRFEFCNGLKCNIDEASPVCGIKEEQDGVRLKMFKNECEFHLHGCSVDDTEAYGKIDMEYCEETFSEQINEALNIKSDENKTKDEKMTKKKQIDLTKYCDSTQCDAGNDEEVCGIRSDGQGFRVAKFRNRCAMEKCNCINNVNFTAVEHIFCHGLKENNDKNILENDENKTKDEKIMKKKQIDDLLTQYCDYIQCDAGDDDEVCGIRSDGEGFRVAKFHNQCAMEKCNCINNVNFTATEHIFCHGLEENNDKNILEMTASHKPIKRPKNIVVINVSGATFRKNMNNTINDFFAATHVMKFPIQKIPLEEQIKNITRRNMLVKNAGPVVVFKPWIVKPKNVSEDMMHEPTIASCYHRCPEVCPDTYTPVCGAAGSNTREPSLMFQNHCFMDMAQCKMRWEDKSPTSEYSNYIESSFFFCLGDEMNSLLRFLPMLRTLQRMGRVKKKGKYRYKLRNLRFLNENMIRQPNIMGR